MGLKMLRAVFGSLLLLAAAVGERPPAVSGRFYPSDAAQLRGGVEAYLAEAQPPRKERPVALILPHAGHIYSGQIAADGYRQAMEHEYDLIVILGTNHTVAPFNGVSIYPSGGYRTPLGLAEIDEEAASALAAADDSFGFRPAPHEKEHSIEVHVPFVQVAFPGVKILPAIVGRPDEALCASFGKALAKVLKGRKALIVASSDLSHYPTYEDAIVADHAVLAAMASMDTSLLLATMDEQMRAGHSGLSTCACGEAPALAAMTAARELGAGRGVVISYANSGDTSIGDRSRVVGYGAVAFVAGEGKPDTSALRLPAAGPHSAELSPADRKAMLVFARSSIERYLTTGTLPLARGFSPVVWREQAVFVTLKKNGQLRGCIGQLRSDRPLCQAVGAKAIQAAFKDRRFSPVVLGELPDIDIEISLLTPPKRVAGPEAIEIGRDGVTLLKDGRRATFLPEVAVEQGWERDEMLEQLCRKAGLPAACWREGAEFETYRTIAFHESDGG
jgi:AmmeMemoRadiSam system protein B/AmmeMemoRadiSam system protein A